MSFEEILKTHLVAGECFDDFAFWAFGENYFTFDNLEFIQAWNTIHGKELRFYRPRQIREDTLKMVEHWRDSMDKKIHKIEKETKKVEKDLKGLAKADKKRDKLVEKGLKMKKK